MSEHAEALQLEAGRDWELGRYLDRISAPQDEEDMTKCELCHAGLLRDEDRTCGEISCKSFRCGFAGTCEGDGSICDCDRKACTAFKNMTEGGK